MRSGGRCARRDPERCGRGKDQAGTASLLFLDRIGLAAATADSQFCRIADAADMLASGIISAVNRTAAALGCAPGQTVLDCAGRMRSASLPAGPVPQLRDSRIVVTASHGALVGGRPNEVVPSGVFAAFFHDAGGARAGSGYSRLASLDALGVVAGTVAADSARVGDARSCYQDGVPPHVNGTARERGGHRGLALHAAIDTLRQA